MNRMRRSEARFARDGFWGRPLKIEIWLEFFTFEICNFKLKTMKNQPHEKHSRVDDIWMDDSESFQVGLETVAD